MAFLLSEDQQQEVRNALSSKWESAAGRRAGNMLLHLARNMNKNINYTVDAISMYMELSEVLGQDSAKHFLTRMLASNADSYKVMHLHVKDFINFKGLTILLQDYPGEVKTLGNFLFHRRRNTYLI